MSGTVGDGSGVRFPRRFWVANVTELFERGAYYAMASFVVIYLGRLGLGDYWPSALNGFLWTFVYVLPVLSGAIADRVGFRKSLLAAFVLLMGGYACMGLPVWSGAGELAESAGSDVTAGFGVVAPLLAGILLIGMGGSVIKPCISGTVQKTAWKRATLGFAIFYMVINIGSLFGRGTGYLVRTHSSLSFIFAVSAACCAVAFAVVLLMYRDGEGESGEAPKRERKTVGRILLDMVRVLRNPRFALFLLVSSGFWFLYAQVYNVLPLYLSKVVEGMPPVDLYTMANPVVIVCFQLAVTARFGRMAPIRSMVVGTLIIGVAMLVNVVPIVWGGDLRGLVGGVLPLASLFVVVSVALVAFGELFLSARMFEYIGGMAPKGQEGLFLGYASLPTAVGKLAGNLLGAAIFNEVMCAGAGKNGAGLLDLVPEHACVGWVVLAGIGFASAGSMWLYDRWLRREAAGAERQS